MIYAQTFYKYLLKFYIFIHITSKTIFTIDNNAVKAYNFNMNTAILQKRSKFLIDNPNFQAEDFSGEPKYKSKFLNKLNDLGDRFFYSPLYFILLASAIFLCWFFEVEAYGVIGIIFFASIMLVLRRDATPLVPVIIMVAMIFPKDIDPMTYANVFYFFIPLPIALGIHFVRFRVPFRVGKLFFSQLAVSVALLLGGIGTISVEMYTRGLTYALLLGVAILFFYFFFYLYAYPPKNVNFKGWIAHFLNVVGVLISAQVITRYVQNPELIKAVGSGASIGWGVGNNYATVLLISVAGTFYLATKSKLSVVYLLLAVVQYVVIILGWSRGATLFAAIILPMYLVAMIVGAKENRRFVWFALTIVGALLLGTLLGAWDEIMALVEKILSQGTGVSGRDKLYTEAVDMFKAHPIFGAGVGFDGDYYTLETMPMYWFHSTYYQVMGSMGAVGLAAYAFYYYQRYRVMVRKNCVFSVLMLIAMVGFEGYSMIDTGTFVPLPIMIMVILVTMVMELDNARHPETFINYKSLLKRK